MNLTHVVSSIVGLTFAASAFADNYNCAVVRKKGEDQQVVKQFQVVATAGEDTFQAAKIDGSYYGICGVSLKGDTKSVMCGFVNANQDVGAVNLLDAGLEGTELLSLGAAEYGAKQILALHAKDGYQDIALCQKAN